MKSLVLWVAMFVAFAGSAAAQPQYRVTDLGRLPGYTYMTYPLGLNNRGEVVGIGHSGSVYRAFIWDAANGLRALPPVPGQESRSSTAVAINDLGEIIGYCGQSGGSHMVGWLFRNGQYTMLGTLPGYDGCLPAAVNNNTEIVGTATGYGPLDPYTNFYWSPATGMVNVVSGQQAEFYAINDAGVISGGIRAGEPAVGIQTWDMRTGLVSDRGMLPGTSLSFGYSINESNEIAGSSIYISSSGHRTSHAVNAADAGLIDIGLFQAVASGINERGEVVGWRTWQSNSDYYSWVYSPQRGLIADLQAVVEEPAYFSRISGARAINDRGQIIATGANGHFPADPSRRAFILTPLFDAPGDVDGDGDVDLTDLALLLSSFGACQGEPAFVGGADFDGSGCIELADLALLLANFGA
ncbi:MAG: hypothetical protein HZB38_08125 [Planctomycetes bacterium]|nr:hypothetical protein [Planctomycetota bacterium]